MTEQALDPKLATLEALINKRIAAKREEDLSIAHRRCIDAEILARITPPASGEGSVTTKVGDWKLGASFGLDRKADTEAVQADWTTLPATVQAAFRFKAEPDVKVLKALSDEDKLIAAKYITTKPASTSIKLEAA